MSVETQEIINVDNYSFRYQDTKRRALRDISFSVERGSFLSVVGPNGAGKSTLCNALVGLIPHYFIGQSAGRIWIKGQNASDSSVAEMSKTIGLVLQNPFNQLSYTAETVAEELAFGLANHGVPRQDMVQRVADAAKTMRIEDLLERNPLELSGGQVQRVALGSVFIMNPEILVLDECTTQLDPMGSEEILGIVKELNAKGTTVIMVDHDMERVARYADKVVVLDRGRMISSGTPRELFTQANELPVAPVVYAEITRELIESEGSRGRVEIAEEPTVQLVKEMLQ